MDESLTILYEDAHCLAVVKPGGELTQGTIGGPESTLEARVRRYLRPDDPGSVYLGTVHRLDRPVSGVILWAKTLKAARRLAAQFAAREPRKEYWAIVEGTTARWGDEGRWDDWLTDPDSSGVVHSSETEAPGTRLAVTRFRKSAATRLPENTNWLRLWPETGRTHQLRAQTAHRGLPILGDLAYGSGRPFTRGIALHARSLRVRHPTLGTTLDLLAPLPGTWAEQGIVLPKPTIPEVE
ncbi:RluA family pseudouridine synthase [Singulisphaera sp. Ch08]|uniref:RluA family pseudouridine synthase n=1 Tax=Singulisphaera sp. Ch08 TaxID=3120278 RepID=A0AAU7CME6_9BACT